MVNFRFHLVSLVAVFLSLGIGILIGSTVIDQSIVQRLESNRRTLVNQREAAQADANETERQLAQWTDFGDQARAKLLGGRLTEVPVMVLVIEGVDNDIVDRVRDALRTAGAADRGTLRLTKKLALEADNDAPDLATALGSTISRPEALRLLAAESIAEALLADPATTTQVPPTSSPPVPEQADGTALAGGVLTALQDAGFLNYEAPEESGFEIGSLVDPGTRVVVVSGRGAEVADADLSLPLCEALAARDGAAIVAAEPAPSEDAESTFVEPLREREEVAQRVSTVDNLGEFFGDVALVLAVEELASETRGHYGVGPGARLLPQSSDTE